MRTLLSSILFSITITALSQPTSDTLLLNQLRQAKEPIVVFSSNLNPTVLHLTKPFEGFSQQILAQAKRVVVYIDGTGRLYEYKTDSATHKFIRIESTEYRGYNFGSFSFFYKGRIYNLGGWGFWRVNGHLKVFNESIKDWDIVPLSEEIAFPCGQSDGLAWYDNLSGKIYTGFYIKVNEGVKPKENESKFIFKVMVLDLNTMNWEYLGDLTEPFRLISSTNGGNIAMSSWGLLRRSQKAIELWNFKDNRHYEISPTNPISRDIIRGMENAVTFCIDSTLFMYHEGKVDSIHLHYSYFTPTGNRIYYTPLKEIFIQNWILWVILLSVFFATIIYYFIKFIFKDIVSRKVDSLQMKANEAINENSCFNKFDFTEQEILLLSLIENNSRFGNKTSISEINTLLGLEKRSNDTQKSQRHKLITGINNKYKQKRGHIIIQSERSNFDARTFAYFIPDEILPELAGMLK